MTRPVTVLYEDQRGPTKGFGLHELVWRCVYDDIDHDEWACQRALDARPLKGVSKVLRACRDEAASISSDGRQIVAVVDDDAIRRELRLPRDATSEQVAKVVCEGSTAPEKVRVAVLVDNAESVIAAAAACDPAIDRSSVEIALRKGRGALEARDAVLTVVAWGAPSVRACVRSRLPSFDELVRLLDPLVRSAVET